MHTEFVTYEIALKLKELGFDGKECIRVYNPQLSLENTFLYSQAFRWIRGKYGINHVIDRVSKEEWTWTAYNFNTPKVKEYSSLMYHDGFFQTHEEAESACLDAIIEIVKKIEQD